MKKRIAEPKDDEADAAAGGKNKNKRRGVVNDGNGGGGAGNAVVVVDKGKPPTKRSLLRQPNLKNIWPQQPKIQDKDRRAQAYLRAAGLLLVPASSTTTPKDKTNENGFELGEYDLKFGRMLGNPDQWVRHAAVQQLRRYLRAKSNIPEGNPLDDDKSEPPMPPGISELELLKLCKALWHTLYMADKVVVQDELSLWIAKLMWCLVGTPDEDEYAGDCYYAMNRQDESDDDDEDDGGDDDDDDVDDGDSFDDDDVVMEELVNTLGDGEEDSYDDEEGDEEDEGSMSGEEQEAAARGIEWEEDEDDQSEDDNSDDDDDSEDARWVPHCRGAHLASLYVRCLLRTIRREWHRMDKYRLDKFYTLIRHVVHQVYQYLSDRQYHPGIVQLFNDAVFEEVLRETPNGIRYHLIDVAVDELCAVQHKAKKQLAVPFTADEFILVLEPYFALSQHGCGDDSVHNRAVENVLMRFLDRYSVVRAGGIDNADDANGGKMAPVFRHVHVGTIANFIFDIAGDINTAKESYRKALHDTFKAYSRRIKNGIDVDMIQLPNEDGNGADEDTEGTQNGVSPDERVVSKSDTDRPKSSESADPPANATMQRSMDKGDAKKSKKDGKTKKKATKLSDAHPAPVSAPDDDEVIHDLNRSLRDDSPWWSEAAEVVAEATSKKPPAGKKETGTRKKAMVVKAARTPPKSNGAARVITEEELLITLQAQKAARQAAKDAEAARHREEFEAITSDFGKGKTKKRRGGRDDSSGGGTKRVKIGEHFNRARSYSASMQGLRRLDSPARSSVTPERGILLNKDARIIKKADSKSPRRRKAVDYFY